MALEKDTPRDYQLGDFEEYPVAASTVIYEGAAVGATGAGHARPLVAGDPFLGFADRIADNRLGAAGLVPVRVRRRGVAVLEVAGVTLAANAGVAVYATDDGSFTTTATDNTLIGYVSRWVSAGVAAVAFDALAVRAAQQA